MKQGLIRVSIIVGLILAGLMAALYIMFGTYPYSTGLGYTLPLFLTVGIGLYVIGVTALLVGLAATKQRKWSWGIAGFVLISLMFLAMGWLEWWRIHNSL